MERVKDRDNTVMLAVRVPKSLHKEVKVHTATAGTTLAAFVVDAVTEKLKRGSK
jgi:predicted HicB family RNase H-like nuclease